MNDPLATDVWVVGLGFTQILNANQSWKAFNALKTITANLKASKRISMLPTNDGQSFIILAHELINEPTALMFARKLDDVFPGKTQEEIESYLNVYVFAGNNKTERIHSAKQYVENHASDFEGEYVWRLDWHPLFPPFEEVECTPETCPESHPLEWVEVEEP